MGARFWRAGDYWRVCDVCGFDYRASETLKRWDGLIVCHDDWEPRHPQDFVRGRADRQRVHEPRPQPTDTFVDTFRNYVVSPSGDHVLSPAGDEVIR
jgi:hypothetical protein